jgi:hypothetical protein
MGSECDEYVNSGKFAQIRCLYWYNRGESGSAVNEDGIVKTNWLKTDTQLLYF